MKGQQIAVLVLFHEKLAQTRECIDSFLPSGCNVYVLNNCSSEKSFTKLKNAFSSTESVSFFSADQNIGPAQGRNFLVSKTTEEWLFFVDNDITIEQEDTWREAVYKVIESSPEVEVIVPSLYNKHERAFAVHPRISISGRKLSLDSAPVKDLNYFPSGAALVRRNLFTTLGGFDDALFAFEDYEFAVNALMQKKVMHIQQLKEIVLVHDHRYQKKNKDRSAVATRYDTAHLRRSFQHIESKHDVEFEHEWLFWSQKQRFDMTRKNLLRKLVLTLQRCRYNK